MACLIQELRTSSEYRKRHHTDEQRHKLWIDMRQDGMTLAAIAVADGTVHLDTVRVALENSTFGNPKVELPTKTIGKDGKARPMTYKTRSTYLSDSDVKKAQSLPEAQQAAVFSGAITPVAAGRYDRSFRDKLQ